MVVVLIFATISSCDSGGDHHPNIGFTISSGSVTYDSYYTTLPRDTIFTIYIAASKTGADGMLKSFKITRSINAGADSTILDASITTEFFSQYYSYKTGDSGNIEKYTFVVGNTEDLFSSIEFVDTVQ